MTIFTPTGPWSWLVGFFFSGTYIKKKKPKHTTVVLFTKTYNFIMHSVNSDWDPNYTVFKKKIQKSGENSQGDFFYYF